MRTLFVIAAFTSAPVVADEPKPDAPKSRAEQVQAVFQSLETATDKIGADFKAAKDAATKDKLKRQFSDLTQATADKLLTLANEKPDDEPAFTALAFVLANGNTDAAAQLISKHHLGREQLASLFPQVAEDPSPAVTGLLRAALEKSPKREVMGAACMALAAGTVARADRTGDVAAAAEGEALLSRATKEFGDQPWEDGKIKAVAVALLEEVRARGVGKPAPEFASVDLDDKPAKLSDLKGKVVVLDIWATWCPPCRAMIPHERELVKRLAGKPFALVSVSADNKKDDLTEFLKTEPMPWTHWYEGTGGTSLGKWNVQSFPTIYVLDAKGTIRYKGLRGKPMDEAVEKLLAEAEAGK